MTNIHLLKNYQKRISLSLYTKRIYKYWQRRSSKYIGKPLQRLCKIFFSIREQGNNNLRKISDFLIHKFKSVNFGFESIRYLGPKVWGSLPQSLKNKESLGSFKTATKTWKPDRCPCRICKTYLQNIKYLQR